MGSAVAGKAGAPARLCSAERAASGCRSRFQALCHHDCHGGPLSAAACSAETVRSSDCPHAMPIGASVPLLATAEQLSDPS